MRSLLLLALCLTAACGLPRAADDVAADDAKYKLPKGFYLGGGTSSYQTEGAWDEDGKGPNVFDAAYHAKNITPNGDVASDTYHRYKEDIDLAAEIGFNVFRFSLSWARIFPNGSNSPVNEKGVAHYHNFLDKLKEKNLEPFVTLNHFDHPQALQEEFGGWLSDKMPDAFAKYAEFAFKTFGSKVRYWLTVNEASFYCLSLGGSFLQPVLYTTTEKQNTCLKNTLLAHAKAHAIYESKYKKTQKGMVGYGTGPSFSRPANRTLDEDVAAAEKSNEVGGIALSIDPLVFGDFPKAAKAARNLSLTEEEQKILKGSVDFLGINTYGGRDVSAADGGGDFGPGGGGGGGPPDGGDGGSGGGPPDGGDGGSGGGPPDGGDGGSGGGPPDGGDGGSGGGPDGGDGGSGGGGNRPDGFGDTSSAWVLREMPLWVKNRYDSEKQLPIFITENGVQANGNGTALNDWDSRAVYCSAFLRELAAGVHENGTRVFGYTLWSFVDTFEFHSFSNWGVVHVDFDNGSLNRTKKDSWTFFRRVMDTGAVPLVEAGSEPFPAPSSSTVLQSSLALAIAAVLFGRFL